MTNKITKKIDKMHKRVIQVTNMKKGISNNNFWDEATAHYHNCMAAISQVEGQLAGVLDNLINDAEKMKYISDQQGLANNIQILNKDVKEHVERLNAIYAKHSNKFGGTCEPDEHMLLLQIHGEYAEALEIYQANILPTVNHILEQIGAAEMLVQQIANQQTQVIEEPVRDFSQDTAVIDVDFKEVKRSV